MDRHIITIVISTDADPSTILDVAQQFGAHFEEMTSEDCKIDDNEVSVETISD
jgi:hypothetical protein